MMLIAALMAALLGAGPTPDAAAAPSDSMAVSALPDSVAASAPGRIELTIAPVRVGDGGDMLVAIFTDEESWLEMDMAYARQSLPADSDTLRAVFTGVPHGVYAAEVVHDKNRNGKFDMRWFPYPKPKEGAGVSNNNLRKGKPRYEPAVFEVGAEPVRLLIELRY